MKIDKSGISEELREKIIRIVQAFVPEAKIYLYGSRARGDYSERSDIDVAIDTGSKLPRSRVGEVRDVLAASNIIYKIDILDLNNIPEDLHERILKEALLWKD